MCVAVELRFDYLARYDILYKVYVCIDRLCCTEFTYLEDFARRVDNRVDFDFFYFADERSYRCGREQYAYLIEYAVNPRFSLAEVEPVCSRLSLVCDFRYFGVAVELRFNHLARNNVLNKFYECVYGFVLA